MLIPFPPQEEQRRRRGGGPGQVPHQDVEEVRPGVVGQEGRQEEGGQAGRQRQRGRLLVVFDKGLQGRQGPVKELPAQVSLEGRSINPALFQNSVFSFPISCLFPSFFSTTPRSSVLLPPPPQLLQKVKEKVQYSSRYRAGKGCLGYILGLWLVVLSFVPVVVARML